MKAKGSNLCARDFVIEEGELVEGLEEKTDMDKLSLAYCFQHQCSFLKAPVNILQALTVSFSEVSPAVVSAETWQ